MMKQKQKLQALCSLSFGLWIIKDKMPNLVVYGSLMHEDELLKEGLHSLSFELVKIHGYKRVFNQEPSYRLVSSKNRAVLNVMISNESWFNALVLKDLHNKYFETLDKREIGYIRTLVDVITYDNKTINNCYIYLGKENKKNDDILPNINYQELCLSAAKSRGTAFYKDYLKTTFNN